MTTEPKLYEIILANGEWFGICDATELADLADDDTIPMAYTVREYGA